jgi:hypothetical protein
VNLTAQTDKRISISVLESNTNNNNFFNNGAALYNGWGNPTPVDSGTVYTKWVGCANVDVSSATVFGQNILSVDAASLMQDKLDSNPATIPQRNDAGGWDNYEAGPDTNHGFVIIPKGSVPYKSGVVPTPGSAGTPLAGIEYSNVVVNDMGMTPTPESTNVASATDTATDVPVATTTPIVRTVQIKDYLKGVLYGLVGDADFHDTKYKEGFKALGIAAYTLLLNEVQKNSGADVMVNGYSSNQKYFIPYKDFGGIAIPGTTKDLISKAIDEICATIGTGPAARNYIQAFWFNKVIRGQDDFTSMVSIDGAQVKWPKVMSLVFSYSSGANAKNILINSSQDALKIAKPYLPASSRMDEATVSLPPGLSSGTKCGMSAWAALNLSTGVNVTAQDILNVFYHTVPTIKKMAQFMQKGNVLFTSNWSAIQNTSNGYLRARSVDPVNQPGIDPTQDLDIVIYLSDKIALGPDELMTLKEGGTPVTGLVFTELPATDEYSEILKCTVPSVQLQTVKGTNTSQIVTLGVSCRGYYDGQLNDQNPDSPVFVQMAGEPAGYQGSVLGSDDTDNFTIINPKSADDTKNGTSYGGVVHYVTPGASVSLPAINIGNISMPSVTLPNLPVLNIPRPDLKNVHWGFDGSKFGIAFFPGAGQGGDGYSAVAGAFQSMLGSLNIKPPQISIPPINTGLNISSIIGTDPCVLTGQTVFDSLQQQLNNDKGSDGTLTPKTTFGGSMKAVGSEIGGNAILDYMENTNNASMVSGIASASITGAYLGGMKIDACAVLMQAQDVANKVSVGIALVSAVQLASGNPAFGAYLMNGSIGYARTWGEGMIKAYAFRGLDSIIANTMKNNEGYVSELMAKMPGQPKFPGFGGAKVNSYDLFTSAFGCTKTADLDLIDWKNIKWWDVASQIATYASNFKSNDDIKDKSDGGTGWLDQATGGNAASVIGNLNKFEKLNVTGIAGKKGSNTTVKSEALGLVSEIMTILKNIPEPITNSISSIGPIIVSMLNSTDGNLLNTVENQLGSNTDLMKGLQDKGKAMLSQIDTSSMPQLPTTIPGLSALPIKLDFIPFLGPVFNEIMGSLSFGRGSQLDPGKVLSDVDEAGEVGIFYPYIDSATTPLESYNGWISGVTTDNAFIHVEGWGSDYLPQFLQIYAQADKGPVSTTILKLDTTLVTTADGKRGKADWAMDVALPHAGQNTVHVWTMNAGGHQVDMSFLAYLVGTTFPQQGSRAIPISSFVWRAYNGGILGIGGSVSESGGGTINFISTNPGDSALSDVFTATANNAIKIFYPDDTDNPDLMLADENGNTLSNQSTVPGDGKFRFKLKSRYTGKSFITMMGAADALKFKNWCMQYCPAGANMQALHPDNGFNIDSVFDKNTAISSNQRKEGPLFQVMGSWDVWSKRLTGEYYLRTMISDDNLNYTNKELDRAQFTIGTPIDLSNTAPTIVSDPYFKAQLQVPNGAVMQTQYVNIYSENTDPIDPLPATICAAFTSKYGVYPALDSSNLNAGSQLTLTIKYTNDDLASVNLDSMFGLSSGSDYSYTDAIAKAKGVLEDNLGIYREVDHNDTVNGQYVTITARELMQGTQHPIGSYTVMTQVAEAKGRYFVMDANNPPAFRYPAFASPFIFNPEEESKGRTTTAIYFTPMATTSRYIFADVTIMDQNKTRVVKHLYEGIKNKQPIELKFAGKYGDIDPYNGTKYYFYNYLTGTSDAYRSVLAAPLNGVTWDGIGDKDGRGTIGIVDDGVYRAVITVMDSFGNSTVGSCFVVKGRIVPQINQVAGKAAVDGMQLGADVNGNTVAVIGTATGNEAFKGYMVGYRPSSYVVSDPSGNPDEGYQYIELPKEYTGGVSSTTVTAVGPTDGKLADLDISEMYNGTYDLTLFILGQDESGVIKTLDRATVHNMVINNPQGIFNYKADPNPFSTGTTLTANVNIDNIGEVDFNIAGLSNTYTASFVADNIKGVKYSTFWSDATAPDGYYNVSVTAGATVKEFLVRKYSSNTSITANITSPPGNSYISSDITILGSAGVADAAGQTIPVQLHDYKLYKKIDSSDWELVYGSMYGVTNGQLASLSLDQLQGNNLSLMLVVTDTAGNSQYAYSNNIAIRFSTWIKAEPDLIIRGQGTGIDLNYYLNKTVTSMNMYIGYPSSQGGPAIYYKNFTLSPDYYTPGTHTVKWDGLDSNGNTMPTGAYNVWLEPETMYEIYMPASTIVTVADPMTITPNTALRLDGNPAPYFDFVAQGNGSYDRPITYNMYLTGYATENYYKFLDQKGNLDVNSNNNPNSKDCNFNINFNQNLLLHTSTGDECGSREYHYDINGGSTVGMSINTDNFVPVHMSNAVHLWVHAVYNFDCGTNNTNASIDYTYRDNSHFNTVYDKISKKSSLVSDVLYLHRSNSIPFGIDFSQSALHNGDYPDEPDQGTYESPVFNKNNPDEIGTYSPVALKDAEQPVIVTPSNIGAVVTGWVQGIIPLDDHYQLFNGQQNEKNAASQSGTISTGISNSVSVGVTITALETYYTSAQNVHIVGEGSIDVPLNQKVVFEMPYGTWGMIKDSNNNLLSFINGSGSQNSVCDFPANLNAGHYIIDIKGNTNYADAIFEVEENKEEISRPYLISSYYTANNENNGMDFIFEKARTIKWNLNVANGGSFNGWLIIRRNHNDVIYTGNIGECATNGEFQVNAGDVITFEQGLDFTSNVTLTYEPVSLQQQDTVNDNVSLTLNAQSNGNIHFKLPNAIRPTMSDGVLSNIQLTGTNGIPNDTISNSLTAASVTVTADATLKIDYSYDLNKTTGAWSVTGTVQNNVALWGNDSTKNIFQSLSATAGTNYQPVFPSPAEYASVTTTVKIPPGPDKVPHSSGWTVKGPYYPDSTAIHDDIVAIKNGMTTTAMNNNSIYFNSMTGTSDGFEAGISYDQYDIDKVDLKLRDPSPDPYVSNTYARIYGDTNIPGLKYYSLFYKMKGVPDSYHLINKYTTGKTGILGYLPVKDKIGRYDIMLNIVDNNNRAYSVTTESLPDTANAGVGHHISTAGGGTATDAYEQVFLSFAAGALRQDKLITITPLKRSAAPIVEDNLIPASMIYDFRSADLGSAIETPLRTDDFVMDAKGNIPLPATLTMLYDTRQLNGFDESVLSLYKIHETSTGTSELMLVPAYIDKINHVLTAEITSFSTVQLIPNYAPPSFEFSANPDPAGRDSIVNIDIKSTKTLSGNLTGNIQLSPSLGGANFTPVFIQQTKAYMTGTAQVAQVCNSQYNDIDNYKLILGSFSNDGSSLPNNGIPTQELTIKNTIFLNNTSFIINKVGINVDNLNTTPTSRFWVTLASSTAAADIDLSSILQQGMIWIVNYKNIVTQGFVQNNVQTTCYNRLILKQTAPNELFSFPPVGWWNGKQIKISNNIYYLRNVQIAGNQISGATISSDIGMSADSNTLTIDTTTANLLNNQPWTLYSPSSDYMAAFNVSAANIQGMVSGTANVTFSGVDLLGNTGSGSGSFVIDTTIPPVTIETDKNSAKSGDTIIIRAKSNIAGYLPNLTLTQAGNSQSISIDPTQLSIITIPGTNIQTGEIVYNFNVNATNLPGYEGNVNIAATVTAVSGTYNAVKQVQIDTVPPVLTILLDSVEPLGIGKTHIRIVSSEPLSALPTLKISALSNNTWLSEFENVYGSNGLQSGADVDIEALYDGNSITAEAVGYDLLGNSGTASRIIRISTGKPPRVTNLTGQREIGHDPGNMAYPANHLTWDSMAEGYSYYNINQFIIFRDDAYIGYVTPDLNNYIDLLTGVNGADQSKQHTYYVAAVDASGNTGIGAYLTMLYDSTPPVTHVEVTGNSFCSDYINPSPIYLSDKSLISLVSIDTAAAGEAISGVYGISYNFKTYTAASLIPYTQPFNSADTNTVTVLYFRAVDGNGNSENIKSTNIYVDTVAPKLNINITVPYYIGNVTGMPVQLPPQFANSSTWDRATIIGAITTTVRSFSSDMDMLGALSDADLQNILQTVITTTVSTTDNSGIDTMDRVNLLSAITSTSRDYTSDSLQRLSDDQLRIIFKGIANLTSNSGIAYINKNLSSIQVSASDFDSNSLGAGVRKITYQVDGMQATDCFSSFDPVIINAPVRVTGIAEGMHNIEAIAVDNVGNSENFTGSGAGVKYFIIDSTPPTTKAYYDQGPGYVTITADVNTITLNSTCINIGLASVDGGAMPVGLRYVYYSLDGTNLNEYTGPVTLSNTVNSFSYFAVDLVENTENVHTINLVWQNVTATNTPTITATTTATITETITVTVSPTVTQTNTDTVSPTTTPTVTDTITATITGTNTETVTDTVTQTATGTGTSTVSPTATGTVTATFTQTNTGTVTGTTTQTVTGTNTCTVTVTATGTVTQTTTQTATQTCTKTITPTTTGTITGTVTTTCSPTVTTTGTRTITVTNTATKTIMATVTTTFTVTTTNTKTATPSVTKTVTGTNTGTISPTITITATKTVTRTITATNTATMTITNTVTSTPTATVTMNVRLRAQYYSYNTNSQSDTIYVDVRVYNDGTNAASLSSIKARYWYTYEGVAPEVVEDDSSVKMPSGQHIESNTIGLLYNISYCGQTRAQVTSFDSNSGSIQPGEYVEFHIRVNHTQYSQANTYNQLNDYSFGTQGNYIDWNKITLYYDDSLAWGIEPCMTLNTLTPTNTMTVSATITGTPTMTISAINTGTNTSTVTVTLSETPVITMTPAPGLRLQQASEDINLNSNSPKPIFKLFNDRVLDYDLSKVEIKYWYEFEGSSAETSSILWTSASNVNIQIMQGSFGSGQDRCLSVTFGSGTLPAGQNVEIKTTFHKNDWSAYNQGNDWSFLNSASYIDWNKSAVYYNGALVWGGEPGLGMLSMVQKSPYFSKQFEDLNANNTYSYPNPTSGNTVIRFSLDCRKPVNVAIYDMNDNIVRQIKLDSNSVKPGLNQLIWNLKNDSGKDVANGVYLLRIMTTQKSVTKKIIVLK